MDVPGESLEARLEEAAQTIDTVRQGLWQKVRGMTPEELERYAPTADEIEANERATALWELQASVNPAGEAAQGIEDIRGLNEMLKELYRRNTLGRTET